MAPEPVGEGPGAGRRGRGAGPGAPPGAGAPIAGAAPAGGAVGLAAGPGRAGSGAVCVGCGAGRVSRVPTTSASGVGPIRARFASYSARQPPRTRCSRAIECSDSPTRTTCVRPLSPYRFEHTGQASQPWVPSTSSATRICCSLVARSALGAKSSPPCSSQVGCRNWSPP